MSRSKPEEQWAARCVERALGLAVRSHDDGSQPSMHDFDLILMDGQRGAIEVTAAADPTAIELWKLVNTDGRWIRPELDGGWLIELLPEARVKALRNKLPRLLQSLEMARIREVSAEWSPLDLRVRLRDLSIRHALQSDTDYPGSVYFTIQLDWDRMGGMVPVDGEALTRWVDSWLMEPAQAHNRKKLASSGADERHLFVILPGLNVAPFQVMWLLMTDDVILPVGEPELPPEITHLWLASSWSSGYGIRWSPNNGWSPFDKLIPVAGQAA